jgi:hypothetical protein
MDEQRKQQIISILQGIYDDFLPTEDEPEMTMFGLISRYNATDQNIEFIGGDWVVENCPDPLKSLPI